MELIDGGGPHPQLKLMARAKGQSARMVKQVLRWAEKAGGFGKRWEAAEALFGFLMTDFILFSHQKRPESTKVLLKAFRAYLDGIEEQAVEVGDAGER